MRNRTGLAVMLVLAAFTGCVRRTLRITSEPPGALVYLNDQEIGRTEVTTDFLWYGDYDVVLRKEGYQTLATHWRVKPPWYQVFPLDFFSEVLWPGKVHDVHERHFTLEEEDLPAPEEVVERAEEMRKRALSAGAKP